MVRIQLVAILAMVSTCILPAKSESHATDGRSRQVVVAVYNDAGVKHSTLRAAENAASQIYRQADLEILWNNCAVQACDLRAGQDHLAIRIEHQPRTLAADVYGVAFLGDGGGGAYCDLFYDRISELYRHGKVSESRILG